MVDYNGVATTTEHGGEAPTRACALMWLTKRSQRASAGTVSRETRVERLRWWRSDEGELGDGEVLGYNGGERRCG